MGQRLADARRAKGYTQKQMAEMFGITEVAWRNYEKGRELRSGMIVSICAVLECSPNWLLGYHDKGRQLAPDSLLLKQLKDAFNALNDVGRQKVAEYARDLTHNPACTGQVKNGGSDSVQGVAK